MNEVKDQIVETGTKELIKLAEIIWEGQLARDSMRDNSPAVWMTQCRKVLNFRIGVPEDADLDETFNASWFIYGYLRGKYTGGEDRSVLRQTT